MDRAKELFKVMFLIYLLGKDTNQPANGQDYLQQVMRAMQQDDISEDLNDFIRTMGSSNPEEMLHNFLNCVCNVDEIFRENQGSENEMTLAINVYVCCIMYLMGLPFPIPGESCGPSLDELCDIVQKEIPTVESDADAILQQLNLSFVVFDNDNQDDLAINDRDMAPRRFFETQVDVVNMMFLLKRAKVMAERYTGYKSHKIEMVEPTVAVESFIEIIENPFGVNGVVTLNVKKIPKAVIGTSHFNVSIKSTETFVPFEEEVKFTEVDFHDGVTIQKKSVKMRFQKQRCSRWA